MIPTETRQLWARTWIIWPVAAVLFAALLALRRMLRQPR